MHQLYKAYVRPPLGNPRPVIMDPNTAPSHILPTPYKTTNSGLTSAELIWSGGGCMDAGSIGLHLDPKSIEHAGLTARLEGVGRSS